LAFTDSTLAARMAWCIPLTAELGYGSVAPFQGGDHGGNVWSDPSTI
jgi:hypothetical protein